MIISLQYLRAIAALMVVAFHAADKLSTLDPDGQHFAFTVGLAGVDIFFVISGFIIYVTGSQAGTTPASFLRKRLIRIVPLYWVLTLMLAAVAILKPGLLASSSFELPHFIASLLFVPWPHPQIPALLPLLIPGWTLNYEMAFYGLFALGMLLPRSARLPSLVSALCLLAALGMMFAPTGIAAFYSDQIILEFAAGTVIAAVWMHGSRPRTIIAVGVFAAGAVLLCLGAGSTLPRVIGAGVPAAMIVSGAVFSENIARRRPIPLLSELGDASYSIYLSHVVVLPVLARFWQAARFGVEGRGTAFFLSALIASAMAGVALHRLVERPLLAWMSGRRARDRAEKRPIVPAATLPAE